MPAEVTDVLKSGHLFFKKTMFELNYPPSTHFCLNRLWPKILFSNFEQVMDRSLSEAERPTAIRYNNHAE